MDSRHKNKAITGTVVWFAAIPLVLAAHVLCKKFISDTANKPDETFSLFFLLLVLVQYLAFFWGGNHLAKAKGYSNALLLFGIFWPAQFAILIVLLFALQDKCRHSSSQMRKRRHSHDESHLGRIVRYRRNALVGIVFGLFGIVLALSLVFFPVPFSQDPSIGKIVAIFVFLAGYAGVIRGCWWWVKAKGWIDAIVFIGLAPLAVLFIRWVRLIYVAVPLLLPVSMVMMPLILIVVVAGLPDKSGMPRHR